MDKVTDPEVAVVDVKKAAKKLAKVFAARAVENDETDKFVQENYADLKGAGLISAGVPRELGGGGASVRDLCEVLRIIAGHVGQRASHFRCIPIRSRFLHGAGTIKTPRVRWLSRFCVASRMKTSCCSVRAAPTGSAALAQLKRSTAVIRSPRARCLHQAHQPVIF